MMTLSWQLLGLMLSSCGKSSKMFTDSSCGAATLAKLCLMCLQLAVDGTMESKATVQRLGRFVTKCGLTLRCSARHS